MGLLVRKDFSRGWSPSIDDVNGPPNALLRMDNCVLDELGAVSLRLGSSRIVAAQSSDIHSLYTAYLSGTRYRMIGSGNTLQANSAVLAASGAGSSGDGSFASYLGQVFYARNTYKKKWDGTNLRAWGLTAPAAPTATPTGGEFANLATCASTEAPAFVAGESGATGIAFVTGVDGTANGAISCDTSTTTFRTTITKTWPAITGATNATPIEITAATHGLNTGDKVTVHDVGGNTAANGRWTITRTGANTFTLNGSAGNAGYTTGGHFGVNATTLSGGSAITDLDVLEMYVYLPDPSTFKRVTLAIDVNDGTFGLDYYQYTWEYQQTQTETITTTIDVIDRIYQDADGTALDNTDLQRVETQTFERLVPISQTKFRPDRNNWNYINAPRGDFERSGSSLYTVGTGTTLDTLGWNSIKAVRITYEDTTSCTPRFDNIRAVQGLRGNYVYRTTYVNETGTYIAQSPPSAATSEVALDNDAGLVTWVASADAQVTHVYIYRMGGGLDRFYRVGRIAVGTLTFTDTIADATAIITNISLQADDAGPPDSIIGIEADHFFRVFCLTQNYLYPSRRLQPDNYSAGQAIRIGDGTRPAYWIKKAFDGLYVGGQQDIYRLEGEGTENPDGTVNFTLKGLNMAYPPVDAAIAAEGNHLIYRASDGWRLFTGQDSVPLRGDTDLLWKGYTRYGVSPPNATSASARFRAAISNGILYAITPEGSSTTSSTAIWKYNFKLERWYRHTYPTAWQTIVKEPDGTVVAGESTAGYTYQLDTGTQDNGANIPVVIWTIVDDDGHALTRKSAQRHYARLETGGLVASVALHLNGAVGASQVLSLLASGETRVDTGGSDLTIGPYTQIQHRVTGSFSTFKLYELGVQYNDFPTQFYGQTPEIQVAGGDEGVLSGIKVRACTLGSARSFGVYLDDTSVGSYSMTTDANDPDTTIFQFTEPKTAIEAYLKTDGNVELYEWQPLVMYRNPLYRLIWDTGFAQMAQDDFAWVRGVRFKAKFTTEVTVTPYFDGKAFPSFTVQPLRNAPTQYDLSLGRDYKGHQPRFVFSSSTPWQLWWVDLFIRDSGHVTQKRIQRLAST